MSEARRRGAPAEILGVPVAGRDAGPAEVGTGRDTADRRSLEGLAAGSMVTTSGMVATGILGFILVIVVTRGLGPLGAGVFFQSVALFSVLASLCELGAPAGLVRTIPRYRAMGRTRDIRGAVTVALWPVAIVSTAVATALFILAPHVAALLGLLPDEGPIALRSVAPVLPLAALSSVALAVTRGFGKMAPYVALENVLKPGLRPLLVAVAVGAGLGATAALAAWAVPAGLILAPALLIVARYLRGAESGMPVRTSGVPRRLLASEFWRFAAPRGMASIFHVAIVWIDVILIGSLRSTEEAGLYAAVGRLVVLGVFAIEGVRLAIAPQVSRALATGDQEGARLLYRVGTWWLVAVSWPMYLTLAIFAPFILRIFGPEFDAGATALLIISLTMLIGVGTGNVSVVLLMGGKSVWNLLNTAAALLVNLVLNILLIPRYGMTGAAIAWAASILVNNLLPLAQVWRALGLNPFGQGFVIVAGISIACFAGIGLTIRTVLGPTWFAFILAAASATILYGALLFRFRNPLHLPALGHALAALTRPLRKWGAGGPRP
jgi:O-antigen/teichoic acid export membrane protein